MVKDFGTVLRRVPNLQHISYLLLEFTIEYFWTVVDPAWLDEKG